MVPNLKFLITMVLALSCAKVAFANGGAGARGGGTGVICKGDSAPITLEEFQLKQSGIQPSLPDNRANALAWIQSKISSDTHLSEAFSSVWNQFGTHATWDEWNQSKQKDFSTLDSESGNIQLAQTIESLFEGTQYETTFSADSKNWLVHDDFQTLPEGCEKIQLSLIFNQKTYRVYTGPLSEQTARFLELHESLYWAGMQNYKHHLPGKTRALIFAMNAATKERRLQKELNQFTQIHKPTAWSKNLNGIVLLTGHTYSPSMNPMPSCPLAISFSFDGESQQSVFLEAVNGKLKVLARTPHPLPKPSAWKVFSDVMSGDILDGKIPAITFMNDEVPFAPGWVNLFNQSDSKHFDLTIVSREYSKMWFGVTFPKTDGQVKQFDHPMICGYTRWTPGEDIDQATLVKTWNQVLLNSQSPKTSVRENEFK